MSETENITTASRASTPFRQVRFLPPTPEGTPDAEDIEMTDAMPNNDTISGGSSKVPKKDPLPPVVKLCNSKGSDHLDKHFEETDGIFFPSSKAAIIAVGPARWHPPTEDDTIPQTDEQDRVIVRSLFDSLRDIDTALDTVNSPYRKRFTPGKDTCYEAWTVEACAWEILNLVKSLHTSGFKAAIFDAHILADIGQTEKWTFAQRIDMICRVVRNSKNVAVTLMKREKIWTIIGAPHKLYHSNLINTVSNRDRNLDVKNGRAARKGTTLKPALKRKASEDKAPKPQKAMKKSDTATPAVDVPATPAAEVVATPAAEAPATTTPAVQASNPTAAEASSTAATTPAGEISTTPLTVIKAPTGTDLEHAELLMGLRGS